MADLLDPADFQRVYEMYEEARTAPPPATAPHDKVKMKRECSSAVLPEETVSRLKKKIIITKKKGIFTFFFR